MTESELQAEIDRLSIDIRNFQHDLTLATGARQAFQYILDQLRAAQLKASNTDEGIES